MMDSFSHISGHKPQISALLGMVERGTLPHGLVLAGAEHSGKATVARALAAALLGVSNDELSRHPDFIAMAPIVRDSGSRAYDLDDIRDALTRLGQSAVHGQTIAIFDDANVLSVAAQNALLKTLEEPAGKTVVILVVHELSAMLPTVLSRTVTVPFAPNADRAVSPECLDDVKHLTSSSLVDRLKVAQSLGKREVLDVDALLGALVAELERSGRTTSRALDAVLKTRERIAGNGNSTIAFEQLALQLGKYE